MLQSQNSAELDKRGQNIYPATTDHSQMKSTTFCDVCQLTVDPKKSDWIAIECRVMNGTVSECSMANFWGRFEVRWHENCLMHFDRVTLLKRQIWQPTQSRYQLELGRKVFFNDSSTKNSIIAGFTVNALLRRQQQQHKSSGKLILCFSGESIAPPLSELHHQKKIWQIMKNYFLTLSCA